MNKSPEQRTVEMLVRLHFGRGRKGPPEDPAARKDHELTRGWGWGGNTLGIGIGEKHVNGQRQQGQRCLTILARRKRAKRHLSDSELIPPSLMLESVGERIVTDVIAVPGWGPHAQASRCDFPTRAARRGDRKRAIGHARPARAPGRKSTVTRFELFSRAGQIGDRYST